MSRSPKSGKSLSRTKARKTPLQRILIVCEGSKTEPLYFRDLISSLELISVQVDVEPSPSTCPSNLVDYAEQRYDDEAFDSIYCVFDKDTHAHYTKAVDRINGFAKRSRKIPIFAVNSVPCFEYWLILHYSRVNGPYGNSTNVLRALKQIPAFIDYEKASKGVYGATYALIPIAVQNAILSLRAANVNGTDDATTRVHELVTEIFTLAEKQKANI